MASELAWGKEAVLRQIAKAQKSEKGYLQSYSDLPRPKPKPSFIDSYMASAEQNTGRHERSNAFENVLVAVFIVGAVLYGLVEVAIGAAGLLFTLLVVVIGVFIVASLFGG